MVEEEDDNALIIEHIKQRLEVGLGRYGHGVRIEDNTKQYGTRRNDWAAMSEEEILDGLIYAAAAAIKQERDTNLRRKHVITLYEREQKGKKTIQRLNKRVDVLFAFILKIIPDKIQLPDEIQDVLVNHLTEKKMDNNEEEE